MSDDNHPRIFADGEAERLIQEPNRRYASPRRDALMMRTMLETGLRPVEVTTLHPQDIDNRRLTVRHGKGGKQRTLPVNDTLASALQQWDGADTYLFPTSNGTATDTSHLRRSVKRYARAAGLPRPDRVSPHSFRHTFATRLYQQATLPTVMKALGHSDASTTMTYVHCEPEDLESVMAA